MQSQPQTDWVTKGDKFALHLHFSIQMQFVSGGSISAALFLAQPFSPSWLGAQRVHVMLAGAENEPQLNPPCRKPSPLQRQKLKARFHIRKLYRDNVII